MERFLFEDDTTETIDEGRYVRVAVERGIATTDGFAYRAGAEVGVGDRVRVPLGRGDRPTNGIVIAAGGEELLSGFDPRRVKPIFERTGASLTPELVELAKWLSGYYVCPLGMVLSTMMPAAVKKGVGHRRIELLRRVEGASSDELGPKARATWERVAKLDGGLFPIDERALADVLGEKTVRSVRALSKAGLLETIEVDTVREAKPMLAFAGVSVGAHTPNSQQQSAIDGINATLGTFAPHLILGVTGSGKTEVYLRVVERALEEGRGAIVLVPEIALTPQAVGRFTARFASAGVAVLHSGLTPTQRHKQWALAAGGTARLVVGARSAIFAPIKDLGVIVVDEEQDTSYKQDQLPRYHARDVAIKRAQLEGCPVVLGSATPALESYHNALGGSYSLWRLTERVGGGKLPKVVIVDLNEERRRLGVRGRNRSIGPRLEKAAAACFSRGGQAIFLINRRGFASFVACANATCAWVQRCERCDVSMVVHRGRDLPKGAVIRCHHCLAEQLVPRECPLCRGRVDRVGAGTQRVEDELERLFGESHGIARGRTMLRVDSDSMKSAKDYFHALEAFGKGEVRLLLGTQMIGKGLDFPNVELVGVISADTALALPDFRASERTFQLVNQVAGRAGRGKNPGLVIVQTMEPQTPAIVLAARHDYETFARRELADRRRAQLPPTTRMARIVCRDPDRDKAEACAERLAVLLRRVASTSTTVDGPMPCPIERIADHYRFSVDIVARDARTLRDTLSALRSDGVLTSDTNTAVDVDPVNLL